MQSRIFVALFLLLAGAASLGQASPQPALPQPGANHPRILVFSKTAGFRHDSIPAGIAAIKKLGVEHGFDVDATDDDAFFVADRLMRYSAVVFLNTTGDVLSTEQEAAFEEFVHAGKGFVGIHAAADTEYGWEWYGRLVGARFLSHPEVQAATITVNNHVHPSTEHLSQKWLRTDEWYNFDKHPRARLGDKLILLASVDEATYKGGSMDGDHPIAWCHESLGGRAWYTACGHTIESYNEPDFLKHLLGGIQWAAHLR